MMVVSQFVRWKGPQEQCTNRAPMKRSAAQRPKLVVSKLLTVVSASMVIERDDIWKREMPTGSCLLYAGAFGIAKQVQTLIMLVQQRNYTLKHVGMMKVSAIMHRELLPTSESIILSHNSHALRFHRGPQNCTHQLIKTIVCSISVIKKWYPDHVWSQQWNWISLDQEMLQRDKFPICHQVVNEWAPQQSGDDTIAAHTHVLHGLEQVHERSLHAIEVIAQQFLGIFQAPSKRRLSKRTNLVNHILNTTGDCIY